MRLKTRKHTRAWKKYGLGKEQTGNGRPGRNGEDLLSKNIY
jgi:hypothetical protein